MMRLSVRLRRADAILFRPDTTKVNLDKLGNPGTFRRHRVGKELTSTAKVRKDRLPWLGRNDLWECVQVACQTGGGNRLPPVEG